MLAAFGGRARPLLRRPPRLPVRPLTDSLPHPELPPKPQPPVDYDCCGGGCADCELRIYLRELARWQKQARQLGVALDD